MVLIIHELLLTKAPRDLRLVSVFRRSEFVSRNHLASKEAEKKARSVHKQRRENEREHRVECKTKKHDRALSQTYCRCRVENLRIDHRPHLLVEREDKPLVRLLVVVVVMVVMVVVMVVMVMVVDQTTTNGAV